MRRLFRADAVARALPDDPNGEPLLQACYAARDHLRFEVTGPEGHAVPVEYLHVYEPPVRDATGGVGSFEVVARLAVPSEAPERRRRTRRGFDAALLTRILEAQFTALGPLAD